MPEANRGSTESVEYAQQAPKRFLGPLPHGYVRPLAASPSRVAAAA